MTEMQFKEKFIDLINDETFQEKLKGLKDRDAIQTLFCENGLELTDEMLDGIMEKVAYYEEHGELDEETLEMVAGGGFITRVTAFAVFGAGIGGVKGAIVGGVIGAVSYFIFK